MIMGSDVMIKARYDGSGTNEGG